MRRFALVLASLCVAATLQPAPACVPTGSAAGDACASGGVLRFVDTSLRRSSAFLVIGGWELQGVSAGEASLDSSTACMAVFDQKFGFRLCDLPLTVKADPLLASARITGSFVDGEFGLGKVQVDLTIKARNGTPEIEPSPAEGAGIGCRGAGGGAGSPGFYRFGTVTGTVSFQRRFGTFAATAARPRRALLFTDVDAGVSTLHPPAGCEPDDQGFFSDPIDCAVVEVPLVLFSCTSADPSRTAGTTLRRGPVRISVRGGDGSVGGPIDDPTGFLPTPGRYGCVEIDTRTAGLEICELGDVDVTIDPLLRDGHMKFEFELGGGPEEPPPPFGTPDAFNFGSVSVDLSITGDRNSLAVAPPEGEEFLIDCFGYAYADPSLTEQGHATGSIVFARRYGTIAGTDSSPIPMSLRSSVSAFVYQDNAAPC